MDPLSIAAGIAGLATLGTHLVTEVYQFFDGIADASADVKQTAKDLDSVASILRQLKATQDVSSSCHVTFPSDTRRDLKEVIKGCKAIFVRLEKLMVKYEDVETSLRKRVKWNRVGESEAKKLGGMLAAQKLTLNLTLQLVNNLMTSTIAQGVKSTQSDTRHIIAEMQNLRRELTSKPTIPTDPNFTLSRYLNSASTYAGSTLGSDDEEDLDGSSVTGTRYTQSVSTETVIHEPENQHNSGSSDEKFDSEHSDQSTPVARPVKDAALPAFRWVPLVSKETEEPPEGQQVHPSKPPADVLRTQQASTSNRDRDNGSDSSSSSGWETDADTEDKNQITESRSNTTAHPRPKNHVKRREIYRDVKPKPTEFARVERITNEYEQRRQAGERASRLRENSKGKEKASSSVSGRGVIPPVGKESSRAEHAPRDSADKDHDMKYKGPPPPRRPPAQTSEEDAETRRKTHEAWNKMRNESRSQEKNQPSPSTGEDHDIKYKGPPPSPRRPPARTPEEDAESRRKTYEAWNKMRNGSRSQEKKQSSSSTGEDHDIKYKGQPLPPRRPPARTPEEDAELRRKTYEAWNKMRNGSRAQEKKQPSPLSASPKPTSPQDDGEMKEKTYERQNKGKEGKKVSQTGQGHPYSFPGVQSTIYDDAERSRRTYEAWQNTKGESAPKQHNPSSVGVGGSADGPSIPNSCLKNKDCSLLQPSVQGTPDSSDENTPARGEIDQIPILIEVIAGTKQAPREFERRQVPPADTDDTPNEDATRRQHPPSPIYAASRAEALPVVDREFNTGTDGRSPLERVDPATALPDPPLLSITEPATTIDYTNAPKIDPFIPTHAQNVFNDFFKSRAWKEPVEEEKIADWEWDCEGWRVTEVESGPYKVRHGFPGSEPSQPANAPTVDDTPQTMTSKGMQFTDPLELFDNFMSEQMDITDADDPQYWEPSTVRRPVIKKELPLANGHPVKEWAHVPCSIEKSRNESIKAVKSVSRRATGRPRFGPPSQNVHSSSLSRRLPKKHAEAAEKREDDEI